jgi:hypothetical protein
MKAECVLCGAEECVGVINLPGGTCLAPLCADCMVRMTQALYPNTPLEDIRDQILGQIDLLHACLDIEEGK